MEQISRRTVLTALGLAGASTGLAACGDDEPSTGTLDTTSTHYVDGAPGSGSGTSSPTDPPASSPSGDARMSTVELPAPEQLRGRWAAFAAVWVGAGINTQPSTGPRAQDGDWVYEMELGQWAYLVRFKNGRAVLAGQSNPDIRRSPQQEASARKALLAGTPAWWSTVEEVLPKQAVLGFVMGWDGTKWTRSADAPAEGGFDRMAFYPASERATGDRLVAWGNDGSKEYRGEAKVVADRVIAAGTSVSVAQLKRLGPGLKAALLPHAVKAAKGFAGKGRH